MKHPTRIRYQNVSQNEVRSLENYFSTKIMSEVCLQIQKESGCYLGVIKRCDNNEILMSTTSFTSRAVKDTLKKWLIQIYHVAFYDELRNNKFLKGE
jgi:hypothetical protein